MWRLAFGIAIGIGIIRAGLFMISNSGTNADPNSITMLNPKLDGYGQNGSRYVLTATKAKITPPSRDTVLSTVTGELVIQSEVKYAFDTPEAIFSDGMLLMRADATLVANGATFILPTGTQWLFDTGTIRAPGLIARKNADGTSIEIGCDSLSQLLELADLVFIISACRRP